MRVNKILRRWQMNDNNLTDAANEAKVRDCFAFSSVRALSDGVAVFPDGDFVLMSARRRIASMSLARLFPQDNVKYLTSLEKFIEPLRTGGRAHAEHI